MTYLAVIDMVTDNQHVVDDRVVFLLKYELVEIKDGARSLLLDSAGARLGLSRLISDVDVWLVLACVSRVPSPPRDLVFIPTDVLLFQVELGRQVWIRSE